MDDDNKEPETEPDTEPETEPENEPETETETQPDKPGDDTDDDMRDRVKAIEAKLEEMSGIMDVLRKAVAENTQLGEENVNEAVEESDDDIADPIEDLFSD